MKKLLSAVTSVVMSASLMTGAFASSVSAAGSLTVEQPNISMGEVLDVSAKTFAADGSVEWKLPTITAAPGQTVTMPIVVQGTGLEIAGGQFVIKAASPIAFNSIVTGNAYGYEIASNADENTFLFSGVKGIVAAQNSVVGTLKFTIPADCAEGKYDVKWSESTASAPGGKNVTDKVKFTDGAINVKKDADGTVEWVLDNVTAVPGQKVNLSAYVNNSEGSAVGVAGGQFVIDAGSAVKFDSVKDGGAYDAKIEVNDKGEQPAFLFSKVAKEGVVAADKAEIMTLTYTVPKDCKEGTYDVKWAEQVVSDGLAKNITSKVKFTNGSITVKSDNEQTGKIKWVLGNETAKPGDTVKLNAIVDDSANAAVAIAGAQFAINSASKDIKLVGVSEKSEAYDAAISKNLDQNVIMFGKAGSASVAAKDGKNIVTLEFKVDEKCAEGKYDIKWAEEVISSALSKNITSNVEFVDGSITVSSNPDADAVSWVIPDVTVKAGATSAELKIQVKGNSDLAVAGAQFAFAVKSPLTLKSVSGKPYGQALSEDNNNYLFATVKGATAKDGDVFATLTVDIPAGTTGKFPVSWSDTVVSAEKGVNITSKVKFVDGSITIGETTTTTTEATEDIKTTTSTTGSFPITTTTTAPVVIPEDKSIAWIVGNEYARPGDQVKVEIKVFDPNNKALAIAGAQFDMESGANATLTAVGKKSAYGADVMTSEDKVRLFFADSTLKAAENDSVVAELTYTVSENAKEGEVIPVEIKNLVVAGEKSANIASQVYTVKGSITVLPKTTITETSVTETVVTTTVDPKKTTTSSSTTKKTTTTSSTTKKTTTTSSTTKKTTTTSSTTVDPKKTTTTSSTTVDPKKTTTSSSTTVDPKNTTTSSSTTVDPQKTTTSSSTTVDPKKTTTSSSTTVDPKNTTTSSSTTVDPKNTTTSSSTTVDPQKTTTSVTTTSNGGSDTTTVVTVTKKAGFVKTYASIETEVGYYFSHDDGTVSGGFKKSQIKTIHIYDLYDDGHKEEQTVDTSKINFNGVTPESAYNSVPHVVGTGTVKDFQYSVNVFYDDGVNKVLVDESGSELSITAYIGVKGDITLNNICDAVDASIAQRYYASLSTGATVTDIKCQTASETSGAYQVASPVDAFDQLAAFLGDVTEDEYSLVNWQQTKSERVIDAVDASKILRFYAMRSVTSADISSGEIWQTINKTVQVEA
ncbi:MAG: cellulose-binding protein CttA-related protein [Ruminococcus sp.]|nr:cellulose-binding protein CttA-related protein [Ruminococcus sp.]